MIEVLGKFHGIPGVFVAALFCGTLRYSANNIINNYSLPFQVKQCLVTGLNNNYSTMSKNTTQ